MQIKLPTNAKMALAINEQRVAVAIKFSVIAAVVIIFYLQD